MSIIILYKIFLLTKLILNQHQSSDAGFRQLSAVEGTEPGLAAPRTEDRVVFSDRHPGGLSVFKHHTLICPGEENSLCLLHPPFLQVTAKSPLSSLLALPQDRFYLHTNKCKEDIIQSFSSSMRWDGITQHRPCSPLQIL